MIGVAGRPAAAQRAPHGWVDDSEVAAARQAQLALQLSEQVGVGDPRKGMPPGDETILAIVPILGLTSAVELSIPVELGFREGTLEPSTNRLERYGFEVRWRLPALGTSPAARFVPLIRLSATRLVNDREAFELEAAAVATLEVMRFRFAVDAGALLLWRWKQEQWESHPGAAAQFRVTPALAVGAELYSEIGITNDDTVDWLAVGPSMTWAAGRTWLAASIPVGVVHADLAPRLNWGVAF